MIPASNIIALCISAALAILFPIGLLTWFYRKRKISFVPVSIGAATFFVFALVLEQIMHYFVFTGYPQLKENAVFYVAYGSLAAGIFEECGRFIAFKFLLRKRNEWKDGIAYGIGHGGFEALMIGGIGLISTILTAIMINSGDFPSQILTAEQSAQMGEAKRQLIETPWPVFLLGGFERVFALTVHIAFSIIVLYGVRTNRMIFLVYAILLHALLDVGAALYQVKMVNIWVVESIVFLFAIAAFIFLRRSERFFPDSSASS